MEVIFQGPIFVNNLDYDAYLTAHREEVERLRAEVEQAKRSANAAKTESEWKSEKETTEIRDVSAGQKV